MKLNKLFMLFGGVLMTGALLTSCSDDDNSYDVKGSRDNLAYFEAQALNTPYESTITVTPAGAMGAVGDVMKVYFQQPVGKDTRVTVAADPIAAQNYLDEHELNYTLVPEDLLDFGLASATVKKGTMESEDGVMVRIKNDRIDELNDPEVERWFAAFTIDEVSGDGKASTSRRTFYAIVNTDIQNVLHFVTNDITSCGVAHTPVGIMGDVSVDQPFTFSGALNSDATITLTQDNSLVDQYNEKTGSEAVALPAGLLDITNATVKVNAGESESEENIQMSVPESKLDEIEDGTYVVPFKISVTRQDGTTVDNAGVYFLVIKSTSSAINDDATEIVGTQADCAEFTCIEADNLDPAEYGNFASSTGWNKAWYFLEKRNEASFVVDFGKTLNVVGFYLASYVINGAYVEISNDKQKWSGLGNTSEHQYVGVYDESTWTYMSEYVLYGAMPARYMRVTLDVNSEHRWWDYYNSLSDFQVFVQE